MSRRIPNKPTPHGTVNGYNNYRCRCDLCREAIRAYQPLKDAIERHRRAVLGIRPWDQYLAEIEPRHGTESRYRKGCRCTSCRSQASAERAHRRRTHPVICHKSASSYANGCRCADCREATRLYHQQRRARNGAKSVRP
jgi:hypothetical protein